MSQTQSSKQLSKFGQAFVNYGSYHYDFVYFFLSISNKIIHIICIPLIAATLFSLLSFIPYSISLNSIPLVGNLTIGAPQLLGFIGVFYYISLNPIFGILSAFFMIGASLLWKNCFKDYSTEELFKAVLIIQIVAWGLQFVGHGVFQKRKPALLDNLTQIFNAPMFVMIELFQIFGLKTKQIEEWKVIIKQNVEEFRQKSQKTN